MTKFEFLTKRFSIYAIFLFFGVIFVGSLAFWADYGIAKVLAQYPNYPGPGSQGPSNNPPSPNKKVRITIKVVLKLSGSAPQGVPGVTVQAVDLGNGSRVDACVTDVNGYCHISFNPPGEKKIKLIGDQFGFTIESKVITVKPGDELSIELTAKPKAKNMGFVIISAEDAGTGNIPPVKVRLSSRSSAGQPWVQEKVLSIKYPWRVMISLPSRRQYLVDIQDNTPPNYGQAPYCLRTIHEDGSPLKDGEFYYFDCVFGN